jgi:hypothetical protein
VCSKKAPIYCGVRDEYDKKAIVLSDRSITYFDWDDVSGFYELVGETRMLKRVPTGFCTVIGPLRYSQREFNAKKGTRNYLDLLTLLDIRRNCKATDPRHEVFSLI